MVAIQSKTSSLSSTTSTKGYVPIIETWRKQDVLATFSLTNYNKGGQPRENLIYTNNRSLDLKIQL